MAVRISKLGLTPDMILKAAIFLVLPLFAGCVDVFLSSSMDELTQNSNEKFCHHNTGVYALPKGELHVTIEKVELNKDTGQFRYEMKEDGKFVKMVADAKHRYCLDFIKNYYYADNIGIKRTPNQLLLEVFSNNDDRSDEIAQSVIDAAGTVASFKKSRGGFGRSFGTSEGRSAKIIDFQFDPFNRELLTATNEALEFAGHCIYLDPADDVFVPSWMSNQCAPKVYKLDSFKPTEDDSFNNSRFEAEKGRFGILYKPLLPHTLVIMKKDDPGSSEPWRIWKRILVEMPNRASPFLLEMKRSAFVERKTRINFQDGLIKDIKIEKPSEALGFANMFVRVVQVVVQIPAKALAISENQDKNRKALIETNQQLIQLLAEVRKDRDARDENFGKLSPEQQAAAIAAGLDPRSSTARALSLEACIRNAALENIEDAERLCLEQRGNQ